MSDVAAQVAAAASEQWRRAWFDVGVEDLVEGAAALWRARFRLALVAGHDDDDGTLRVVYLFVKGPPDQRAELHVRLARDAPGVPSLASLSFPAGRFERELRDLFGVEPRGHPLARPLVKHQHWPAQWHALRADALEVPDVSGDSAPFPFVDVEGPGVYEIPVGPVHAGLIEPGHFRFSVVGETIVKMKARLWYVHKGIERLFEGLELTDAQRLAERISGDSAVGHGLAFCLGVEEALGLEVAPRDAELRGVLLELERLYNHVADVGALCNDAGFALANARALTLRERLLALNERVTGHRLLRGGVEVGGARVRSLPSVEELGEIGEQFHEVVALARANTIVMDRFTGTGVLHPHQALEIGVLGVAARASGLARDARHAHAIVPGPGEFEVCTRRDGDVLARFEVRCDEVDASLGLVAHYLAREGAASTSGPPPAPRGPAHGSGIVEGWRGAIVHRVEFDARGVLSRVKVVDPSFLTWPALAVSLTDTIVPDFPLVNKSFNLSYAGNDL